MKYKIGDRIKITIDIHTNGVMVMAGTKATLIEADTNALIEFDEWVHGHSGEGRGKQGHCWWVNPRHITRDFSPTKKIPNFYFTLQSLLKGQGLVS